LVIAFDVRPAAVQQRKYSMLDWSQLGKAQTGTNSKKRINGLFFSIYKNMKQTSNMRPPDHRTSTSPNGAIVMSGADQTLRNEYMDRLFRSHYGWLCGRLRAHLQCEASAEDLAAETFIQVLDAPAPLAIREPRAFLTTIAKRLLFQTWRRRDLERAYLDSLRLQDEQLVPSPEEQAQLIEALVVIDRLLDGLPSKVKATFLLSQVDGLTYPEIAQALNISQRSVSDYMATAVKRCLKSNLELP
jgi:RNA polymerase sigma factor (sigma-70 family)